MPFVSYSQGNCTLTLPVESYLCCWSGLLNGTLIYSQNGPHRGSNYRVALFCLNLKLYVRVLNPFPQLQIWGQNYEEYVLIFLSILYASGIVIITIRNTESIKYQRLKCSSFQKPLLTLYFFHSTNIWWTMAVCQRLGLAWGTKKKKTKWHGCSHTARPNPSLKMNPISNGWKTSSIYICNWGTAKTQESRVQR